MDYKVFDPTEFKKKKTGKEKYDEGISYPISLSSFCACFHYSNMKLRSISIVTIY
jgi:hypothetical protein